MELLPKTPFGIITGPFNGPSLGLYTAFLSSLQLPLAQSLNKPIDGQLPDRFHSETIKALLSEIPSYLVINHWIDEVYDPGSIDSLHFFVRVSLIEW